MTFGSLQFLFIVLKTSGGHKRKLQVTKIPSSSVCKLQPPCGNLLFQRAYFRVARSQCMLKSVLHVEMN